MRTDTIHSYEAHTPHAYNAHTHGHTSASWPGQLLCRSPMQNGDESDSSSLLGLLCRQLAPGAQHHARWAVSFQQSLAAVILRGEGSSVTASVLLWGSRAPLLLRGWQTPSGQRLQLAGPGQLKGHCPAGHGPIPNGSAFLSSQTMGGS